MTTLTTKQQAFVDAARAMFGPEVSVLTRAEVTAVCEANALKEPQWLTTNPTNRYARGAYSLPSNSSTKQSKKPAVVKTASEPKTIVKAVEVAMHSAPAVNTSSSKYEDMIPKRDKTFVKFGIYSDLKNIIASRVFYPVFITGLSGNGKSFTPEQICAELKREFFRVNITKNTNEDDLLGGFRLINGETVWYDGPVTQAAEAGAVLLLDEIDYASDEISCMQNVLEGKPFLIKKINKVVKPVAGFNIIATANTKGQGDLTGKFVNTNVLNEAFLERFAVALEQEYPPSSVEEKIVKNNLSLLDLEDDDFAVKLVKWAGTNRETFKAGGINEVIATRRLVHIVKAYSMFDKNRIKAVEICLNRFDDESKGALLDLWKKIDATPVPDAFAKTASNTTSAPNSNATQSDPNTVPF
jgi:hypothetical protein